MATTSRQAIADVYVEEIDEELYTSTTKTHEREHEHEDKYEQHQETLKPSTMQELNDANNHLKRGRAADTRRVKAEMTKYSTRRLKKAHTTTAQQSHRTPRATTTKLATHDDQTRTGIWPHHRTTDPFVRSPSCTHSRASSSSSDCEPRWTDHAGFRMGYSTTDHVYTFQQLILTATEWHRSVWVAAVDFKKAFDSTLWSAAAYGRLSGSNASRNHTYS